MSRNDQPSSTEFGIGCLAILLAFPLGMWLGAVSFRMAWEWFVVPLGMPSITTAHALGISGLFQSMTYRYQAPTEKEQEAGWRSILARSLLLMIAKPLLAMVVFWTIHQWMVAS